MRREIGWAVSKAFGSLLEGNNESLQNKSISIFVILKVIGWWGERFEEE